MKSQTFTINQKLTIYTFITIHVTSLPPTNSDQYHFTTLLLPSMSCQVIIINIFSHNCPVVLEYMWW